MTKPDLRDIAVIGGLCLTLNGVGMIYLPLAFILAGAVLVAAGVRS